MPRSSKQKLKLLYVMDFLLRQTDEEHPASLAQLQEHLEANGIAAERKSLYDDFDTLRDYGMDIVCVGHGRGSGYYVTSRDFELPELKLLVDSVQASKFITHKKTAALIRKIERLCSVHEARSLQRQVYVAGRIKTMNESIYYNVDEIHAGISQGKKIRFRYFELDVHKNRRYRRDGAWYVVSPYALIWIDNAFYLVCNNSAHDDFMHLRLDRIEKADVSEESARDCAEFSPIFKDGFDANVYRKGLFNAFSGDYENVVLECDDSLFSVIADRFGSSIHISRKGGDGRFQVTVRVMASDGFLRWVYQFGPEMTILEPASLRRELQKRAQAALARYAEES